MVQFASFTTMHAMIITNQKKIHLYETLGNDFNLLAIKFWSGFNYHFDSFFNFLCLGHYNLSSMVLFSSNNPYCLLSTTCVHSLPMCVGHCKISYMLPHSETLFISFAHCSQCTFIISQYVANDALLVYGLLFYWRIIGVLIVSWHVFSCFYLPYTSCGWVPILVFL
jgi:hypothetical protein